jgi:tetratricopeptide (TPR) repeat protein
MKPQSIVSAIVGAFFGLLVGWIIGSQQQATLVQPAAPVAAAQQQAAPSAAARPLDENQVSALRAEIQRDPASAKPRVDLANLYYDAERYQEAAKWYEEALRLDPKDVNVSTDLGVSYYQMGDPDRALQQFDHSLTIDPRHTKTLLNQGVVRAFGKEDIEGAAASWQKVIDLAPGSQEAQTAKRMLDNLRSAHPPTGSATPAASGTPGSPRGQ